MRSLELQARRHECSLGNSQEHSQLAVRYFAGSDLARRQRPAALILLGSARRLQERLRPVPTLQALVRLRLAVVMVATLMASQPALVVHSLLVVVMVLTLMARERLLPVGPSLTGR
jgi:hypothetical protein